MSHEKGGNVVLQLLSQLFLSVLKLTLLVVGWCLKGTGQLCVFFSEFILKFVKK